ncbi:ribokinase [Niallia circulans]|uniref:Ribokinase n=1 Tax=Niallia circulans TaxID=1397 RepID=A0A268F5T2_NIACI|nr:ribokinase [Niallia circulans]AYV66962.1 ribokinase [Niallia circulans]AYV70176.1 ribokinase [Niallia circulans]PAD80725.1 ribokinase [Niallia circulans]
MKILNFGSLNIDKVYSVPHFVSAGETLSSTNYDEFPGGKGLNQSIALAKAGAQVYHGGNIGKDGLFLKEVLAEANVNVDWIDENGNTTGHAIIQVSASGENCILLLGGANKEITIDHINQVLANFSQNDLLLLQNEINDLAYIVETAHKRGLKIALNPSPIDETITTLDFSKIDYLILNEIEAKAITNEHTNDKIFQKLLSLNKQLKIVLTLGKEGVIYKDSVEEHRQAAFKVDAVDTTAAGDTFLGYFLSQISQQEEIKSALQMAAKAAAIAVTRKGASSSIPSSQEVMAFTKK